MLGCCFTDPSLLLKQAIMFPLLLVPTYDASGGDPLIFYATIAGILSGAVAGDHVSPISDTTVLTSLATDCNLLKHVITQSPYVFWLCVFSVLVGTLPVGYDAYPNWVAYLLGYGLILLFIFGVCRPIISKTGAFDPLTELWLRFDKESDVHELKAATVEAYAALMLTEGDAAPSKFAFFNKKEEPAAYESGEEKPVDEEEAEDSNIVENEESLSVEA
jgi:hypothetical protein